MATLLVCHASELERAAKRLTDAGVADLDVLSYGRAASDSPAPPGANLLSLPSAGTGRLGAARSGLGLLRRMRGRRYELALVAHPGLEESWFRGPLLLFPHLAGAKRVASVGETGDRARVTKPRALADAVQWALLLTASAVFAQLAAVVIERIRPPRSAQPMRERGRVVYLRTDVELRGNVLSAGGSMAHTVGVVGALQRRGYEVAFWSTGDIAGVETREQVRLPVVARANVPQEIWELLSGLRQGLTRRPARATAFVYQRYSLNNLAGLLLARRWRVPLVLEVNASEVRWRRDWSRLRLPRLARACEQALFRGADVVATVSDNVRRDVLEEGAEPGRTRTVPNGVDVERFASAAPIGLGLPAGSFVVAFVGLFYPWHGVHVLAEAFTILHRRRPEARLLLVGDGEEAARARRILAEGGAADAYLMPGLVSREEVPRYLAAADVVVSPHANIRDFIGSPIKIFEYMASGRPIVTTRVGQMAELLRDGQNALVVPPEDPEALAEALLELRDDESLRQRLGSTAQEEARRMHSWDARVAAILGVGMDEA